jgi:hypothetical protein
MVDTGMLQFHLDDQIITRADFMLLCLGVAGYDIETE